MAMSTCICRSIGSAISCRSSLDKFDRSRASLSTLKASSLLLKTSLRISNCNNSNRHCNSATAGGCQHQSELFYTVQDARTARQQPADVNCALERRDHHATRYGSGIVPSALLLLEALLDRHQGASRTQARFTVV